MENAYQEEKQEMKDSPEEQTTQAPSDKPPQYDSTELEMDLNVSQKGLEDLNVKSGNANETFDINSTSCITICDSTLEEDHGSTINITYSTISSLSYISMSDVNATGYLSASGICESGDADDVKTSHELFQESDVIILDLNDSKEDSFKKETENDANHSNKNDVAVSKNPDNDENLDCQPSSEFVENADKNIQNTCPKITLFNEENEDGTSSLFTSARSRNLNSTENDLVMALESLNINGESKDEETFLSVESETVNEDSLLLFSCNEQMVGDEVINETITFLENQTQILEALITVEGGDAELKRSEEVTAEFTVNENVVFEDNPTEKIHQLVVIEDNGTVQPCDLESSKDIVENAVITNETKYTEELDCLKTVENYDTHQTCVSEIPLEIIKDSVMTTPVKLVDNQTEELEQLEVIEIKEPSDPKIVEIVIEKDSDLNDTVKTDNSQSENFEHLKVTEHNGFQPSDLKDAEKVIEEDSDINDTVKTDDNQTEKLKHLKVTERKNRFQPSDLRDAEEIIEEDSDINNTVNTDDNQTEKLKHLKVTERKNRFQSSDLKDAEEVNEEDSDINDTIRTDNNQTEKSERLTVSDHKNRFQPSGLKDAEEVTKEDFDINETVKTDKLEHLKVTEHRSTFQPPDAKVSEEVTLENSTINETTTTENNQTEILEQPNMTEDDTVQQHIFKTPRKSLLSDSSNVSFIDYNSLIEASPSVFAEKMPKYEKQADLLLRINSLQQTLARLEMEMKKKERLIIKYQVDKIKKSKSDTSSNNTNKITENVTGYQERLQQAQLKIAELQEENREEKNKIRKLEQNLKEMEQKKLEIILETENLTKEKEKAYWLLEQSDRVMLDMTGKYQALNKKYTNLEKEKELWKNSYEEIKGKYDLAKLVVKGLKENEDIYKKENDELKTKLTEYTANYESFKSKALAQINEANKENLKLHSQVENLTKQVSSRKRKM